MRTFQETLELADSESVAIFVYHPDDNEEANLCLDEIEARLDNLRTWELGFDTETTGLYPESDDCNLRLIQLATQLEDGNFEAYTFDTWILDDEILERIVTLLESLLIIKVGHNLKFDIKFVKKNIGVKRFGRLFDTMQASRELTFGAVDSRKHSLQAVSRLFLELELDKTEQLSDWGKTYLDDEQLRYAGVDAVIPILIRHRMLPIIAEESLSGALENVFQAVEPVAKLELDGFYLERDRWIEVCNKAIKRLEEVSQEIYQLLPSNQGTLFEDNRAFNIRSNELNHRLALAGIKLPKTDKGNETRNKHALADMEGEHEVIPLLLEYSELNNQVTSYGLSVLNDVNEYTNRIHPTYNILGAGTSRFSCFKPNLQKIPRKEEIRSCFAAEKGNKLVIADYSQIELRILTHESKDIVFAEGFRTGKDFHTLTASQLFEVEFDEVTPDQRQFAKTLNFMLVYGGGAHRLAAMLGISLEEAEEKVKRYFTVYAMTDAYLTKAGRKAVMYRMIRTMAGHIWKLKFDRSNKKMKSHIERIGKNARIQGTSADILRRALRLLYDEIWNYPEIKLVNIVHDEIVLEAPKNLVELAKEKLERAMMKAGEEFITFVPIKVDFHIADVWQK